MNPFRRLALMLVREHLVTRNDRRLDARLRELRAITLDPEIDRIIAFRRQHGPAMIPYDFAAEIQQKDIRVLRDAALGLSYILLEDGSPVYWPEHFDDGKIIRAARVAFIEQHPLSPHRYAHHADKLPTGECAILAGASDCMFALSIIKGFRQLFLFEPTEHWQKPMKASLAAHSSKATIVNRFVGRKTAGHTVSLDDYFAGTVPEGTFLQSDIEGQDIQLLLGAENILREPGRVSASVTCYHNPYQQAEISGFFQARGYQVAYSPGFIDPRTARPLQYPYLRRGIVYADPTCPATAKRPE